MNLKTTLFTILSLATIASPQYIQQIIIPQAFASADKPRCSSPERPSPEEGQKFIKKLVDDGMAILNKARSSNKEFADLLTNNFAIDDIAKIVLGRIKLTPEQKKQFIEYYKKIIIKVYASPEKTKNFKGMHSRIKSSKADQGNTLIIATEFQKDSSSPVNKVDWKIFKLDNKILVLDVTIEGLSQLVVDRDTYGDLFFNKSEKNSKVFLNKVEEMANSNNK